VVAADPISAWPLAGTGPVATASRFIKFADYGGPSWVMADPGRSEHAIYGFTNRKNATLSDRSTLAQRIGRLQHSRFGMGEEPPDHQR
jgi:hypothetical protein